MTPSPRPTLGLRSTRNEGVGGGERYRLLVSHTTHSLPTLSVGPTSTSDTELGRTLRLLPQHVSSTCTSTCRYQRTRSTSVRPSVRSSRSQPPAGRLEIPFPMLSPAPDPGFELTFRTAVSLVTQACEQRRSVPFGHRTADATSLAGPSHSHRSAAASRSGRGRDKFISVVFLCFVCINWTRIV